MKKEQIKKKKKKKNWEIMIIILDIEAKIIKIIKMMLHIRKNKMIMMLHVRKGQMILNFQNKERKKYWIQMKIIVIMFHWFQIIRKMIEL